MSDAQRAARYRARRAGQANHADVRSCSDMVLLDKIRAAVSARDTELAGSWSMCSGSGTPCS